MTPTARGRGGNEPGGQPTRGGGCFVENLLCKAVQKAWWGDGWTPPLVTHRVSGTPMAIGGVCVWRGVCLPRAQNRDSADLGLGGLAWDTCSDQLYGGVAADVPRPARHQDSRPRPCGQRSRTTPGKPSGNGNTIASVFPNIMHLEGRKCSFVCSGHRLGVCSIFRVHRCVHMS